MSESGVIPPPADRGISEIGSVADVDGFIAHVCTERGYVRLEVGASVVILNPSQTEHLAHLIVAASWQAGRDTERMTGGHMPP